MNVSCLELKAHDQAYSSCDGISPSSLYNRVKMHCEVHSITEQPGIKVPIIS